MSCEQAPSFNIKAQSLLNLNGLVDDPRVLILSIVVYKSNNSRTDRFLSNLPYGRC